MNFFFDLMWLQNFKNRQYDHSTCIPSQSNEHKIPFIFIFNSSSRNPIFFWSCQKSTIQERDLVRKSWISTQSSNTNPGCGWAGELWVWHEWWWALHRGVRWPDYKVEGKWKSLDWFRCDVPKEVSISSCSLWHEIHVHTHEFMNNHENMCFSWDKFILCAWTCIHTQYIHKEEKIQQEWNMYGNNYPFKKKSKF